MTYAIEDIGRALRRARERKGLSQRELAARSGVRQYQISKFENGTQDLRVSSLVALARALDLEPSLVPRKSLPAVNAIIHSTSPAVPAPQWEFADLYDAISEQLRDKPLTTDQQQVRSLLRDVQHFGPSKFNADELWLKLSRSLSDYEKKQDEASTKELLRRLREYRNKLAHDAARAEPETVRPAYTLDENNDG